MLKTLPALAALAVAGALVVPTVSFAAEKTSARVSYADLNLATDHGKSRRVVFAADRLCGVGKWKSLGLTAEAAACSDDAVAAAHPAVEAAIAAARRGSVTVLESSALIVTVPSVRGRRALLPQGARRSSWLSEPARCPAFLLLNDQRPAIARTRSE